MGGPGQPGRPKREIDDSLLEPTQKGRPLDAKSTRARRDKDGKPTAKPAPRPSGPKGSAPKGSRNDGPRGGSGRPGGPRKPGGRS